MPLCSVIWGEIRRLQAEIRRQDRLAALGHLAAGIAHEIRNPLSAIKGLARFVQEISPEGRGRGTSRGHHDSGGTASG